MSTFNTSRPIPPTLCLILAPTPGSVVVRPSGVLDEHGSGRLGRILDDLLAGQPHLAVTVDLTRVDRCDVGAAEMLEAAVVAAEQAGGTMSLRCSNYEFEAVRTTRARRDHPAGSALTRFRPRNDGRSIRTTPSNRETSSTAQPTISWFSSAKNSSGDGLL